MSMTMLTATHNGLPALAPGTRLLGEIITWSCSGSSIQHLDLVQALRDSRLDEGVARELAPRHAFTRACRKLAQARIIRQVSEDSRAITFQFTAERKEGDRFEYELETLLTLDKSSGKIHCALIGLATLAQEELDRCIEARTGGDLTRVVQRLFERKADLFPIREQGGCYFVSQEHVDFVDRVQAFLGRLNGTMGRFPVPAGTTEGDRSVKEAVANGLQSLIAEYRQAIEGFGEDTRPDTLERAAERIRLTKFKIEGYAAYLAEEKGRLDRELAEAAHRLRARVDELASSRDSSPVAS
jgi:hypothetical protein